MTRAAAVAATRPRGVKEAPHSAWGVRGPIALCPDAYPRGRPGASIIRELSRRLTMRDVGADPTIQPATPFGMGRPGPAPWVGVRIGMGPRTPQRCGSFLTPQRRARQRRCSSHQGQGRRQAFGPMLAATRTLGRRTRMRGFHRLRSVWRLLSGTCRTVRVGACNTLLISVVASFVASNEVLRCRIWHRVRLTCTDGPSEHYVPVTRILVMRSLVFDHGVGKVAMSGG